jgi:hypothetical protein
MKLKAQRFEAVSDIQRGSQEALKSIKENCFNGAFEVLKKIMGLLYMFPGRLF